MSVPSGPLLIVERFEALGQARGYWHVSGDNVSRSKKLNPRQQALQAAKSRLEVESRVILTLWLRVLRTRVPGGSDRALRRLHGLVRGGPDKSLRRRSAPPGRA